MRAALRVTGTGVPRWGTEKRATALLAVPHLFLSVTSPLSHVSSCSRLACSSEGAGRLEPLGRPARTSERPGSAKTAPPPGSARRALRTEHADWRSLTTASEPGPRAEAVTAVTCAKCLASWQVYNADYIVWYNSQQPSEVSAFCLQVRSDTWRGEPLPKVTPGTGVDARVTAASCRL